MSRNGTVVSSPFELLALLLSYIFIFSLPLRRALTIGPITVSRLVGVLLFISWVLYLIHGNNKISLVKFHIIFAILCLWGVISLIWIPHGITTRSLTTLTGLIMAFGMTIIFWDLFNSKIKLLLGVQSYVLGATFIYVGLLWNYIYGTPVAAGSRFTAFGGHINIVAVMLASGIPLAVWLYYSMSRHYMPLKLVNITYVFGATIGILLTGSRQGVVLSIFGLMTILYYHSIYSQIKLFLLVISAMFLGSIFVPKHNVKRIAALTDELISGNLGGRFIRWKDTWEIFLNQPITGYGVGGSRYVQEQLVGWSFSPHNSYLDLLADLGIIGFGLFLLMLIYGFVFLVNNKIEDRVVWLLLFLMSITMLVNDDLYTDAVFWFLLTIILTASNIDRLIESSE